MSYTCNFIKLYYKCTQWRSQCSVVEGIALAFRKVGARGARQLATSVLQYTS